MADPRDIRPPFTEAGARAKVKAAEDAWNPRDPKRVALAYTADSEWRNRDQFVRGREQIIELLRGKWAPELDYRLRKELWAFTEDRIAVRFEYESRDRDGPVVALVRQRDLGVRRRGPDAPPLRVDQRHCDRATRTADRRQRSLTRRRQITAGEAPNRHRSTRTTSSSMSGTE